MSKLREKFTEWMRKPSVTNEYDISTLEQITDDFSVKFAEWCLDIFLGENSILYLDKTTTELLQIFKNNIYGKE